MMKEEFLDRANAILEAQGRAPMTDINSYDYEKIECVYAFHPAIPDVGG